VILRRGITALAHFAGETRYWAFVLKVGVLLFGGLSTLSVIVGDLLKGNLSIGKLAVYLTLWPIAGVFWGSAMWVYFLGIRWLKRRIAARQG